MPSALAAILYLSVWQSSARAIEPQEFYGKTLDAWVEVLRDKDSTTDDRRRAVLASGFFGADAKAVIPDLQELVRQQRFQREAAQSLAAIDVRPEVRIPRLIKRFIKDGSIHLTGAGAIGYSAGARDALVRIGAPAVPALIAVLDGPDSGMRVCAAEALGRIGPGAREAVPALIRVIAQREVIDESEVLVRHAVVALGRIGADAKAALPILSHLFEKRLGDEYELAIALAGIGAPPVSSLADRLVRDGDAYPAEAVLSWLGPKARDAITLLKRGLTDQRLQVRFSSAVALANIEPSTEHAVPVLIEALEHLQDRDLALDGVPTTLGRLGPVAKAALPVLVALVEKGSDWPDLLEALVQIDPDGKRCVPALVLALKHKDHDVVDTAARCLGLLGPRAKEAVRRFRRLLPLNSRKMTVSTSEPIRRSVPSRRSGGSACAIAM